MDFEKWLEYFEGNAAASRDLADTTGDSLALEEKHCIAASIAAFQLGEYSEGRSLMRGAKRFAQLTSNPFLERITRLFIAEEQNHAMTLGRFMAAHGIPLIKKNWTDDVFRCLRKPVGFELSVTVLITAEIISLVYYQALRASTNCQVLKRICTRILAEELMHVTYESQLLNRIRCEHNPLHRFSIRALHTILFLGTTLVVYYDHRSVLTRGGYGMRRFLASAWTEYSVRFFDPAPARSTLRA
jgi:hypothetical protein